MIHIESFGNRNIAIKGVGKLFYESGFPISLTIQYLKERDIEVSILHVADECLKNNWSPKTVITKLVDDFSDGNEKLDKEQLRIFCNSSYEEQREMLFVYLFVTKDCAYNWLLNKVL